jgi:hypothetical protein
MLFIYPFVQVAPLREKLVGTGLLLLNEPLKPIPVDAPAASELFHDKLVAVTCWLDCDRVALQPWLTRCETSGKAKASVQPFNELEPAISRYPCRQ